MNDSMPTRAAVVGYGPAGRAFASAIDGAGASVTIVAERPDSDGWHHAIRDGRHVVPLSELPPEPLLVLSVPDDAVVTVAEELANSWEKRGVAAFRSAHPVAMHLAGSLGLEPLSPLTAAGYCRLAFHPLQTFPTGSGAARFAGIYAGITGEPDTLPVARELAERLGVQPLEIPEEGRRRYHAAAVIVSNFLPLLLELGANELTHAADDGSGDAPIDMEHAALALRPLMRGMVGSLKDHGPGGAMTGPLVRGDVGTVMKHLELLGETVTGDLYRRLSHATVDLALEHGRITDTQADDWRDRLDR